MARRGPSLAAKALAQSIGQPSLTALSDMIKRGGNACYDQLQQH
jgi:hypothetical protein